MSEQGPRALESDRFHDQKPFVDPFDQVALAERLAEARAQRAVALANRQQGTWQPRTIPPTAQARSAGTGDPRSVARLVPVGPPPAPEPLRASPEMRAVPTRASDRRRPAADAGVEAGQRAPDAPKLRRRALPLAALLAGSVAIGVGALLLPPASDAVHEPSVIQLAPPQAPAAPEGAASAPPRPVGAVAPAFRQEQTAGFGPASGGYGQAMTPRPPGAADPQAMAEPQRPPAPLAPSASPGVAVAPASLQSGDARLADRAGELPVPRPPAVAPLRPETAIAAIDAAEPGAPPALAAARVILYYPTGAGDAAGDALAAIGDLWGSPPTATPVGYTIGRTNVRYYDAADLPAAEAVAALLAAEARDFTDFTPQPAPGTIEVWLAGEGSPAAPTSASVQRTQRAAEPARASAGPEPPSPIVRTSENDGAQQRLELQVQRLLREQLRELRRR